MIDPLRLVYGINSKCTNKSVTNEEAEKSLDAVKLLTVEIGF